MRAALRPDMNTRGSILHIASWIFAALSLPAVASAESAVPLCFDGNVRPYADTVPANVPSFLVEAEGHTLADASSVSLIRIEGRTEVALDTNIEVRSFGFGRQYVVRPSAPLLEGHEHVLRFDPCSIDGGPSERRFAVGPAAALPDGPGTVSIEVIARVSGNRVVEYDARSEVTVASADLEPWYWVLDHQVQVGPYTMGSPSHADGSTMFARGSFECGVPYRGGPLVEGTHAVHAYFGGFGLAPLLEIDTTVTLDCERPTYVDYSTGRPLTPEEIAMIDHSAPTSGPDASIPELDAATSSLDASSSSDAGTVDPDTVRSGPEPSRSACSIAHGASPSWLSAIALLVVALIAGRRLRFTPRHLGLVPYHSRGTRTWRGTSSAPVTGAGARSISPAGR